MQQGPTTRDDVIAAVLDEEPEAYSGTIERQLYKKFYDDLARIRNNLLIDLRVDPRTKQYGIQDVEQSLLALPTSCAT